MELNTKADQPVCSDIPGSLNTLNEEGRHHNDDDIQKISPNSEVGEAACENIVPRLSSISPDLEAHSVCVLNGECHGIDTMLLMDSVEDDEAASSKNNEVENKTTEARGSGISLQKEDGQGESFRITNGGLLDDALSVCVLNGEYRGIGTLLSMDSVDIFEIIREEILAAEAREFEVIENGLLNAGEVGHEVPPRDSVEGSVVCELEVTGIDKGGSQGYAEKCALQDKDIQVRDSALMRVSIGKEEDGQVVSREIPNGELLEDTVSQKMVAEEYDAASSEDNKRENITTEARNSDVFLQKEDGQGESLGSANGGLLDDPFSQEVAQMGAKNSDAAPSDDNKVGFENHQGVMSAPSEDNKCNFGNCVSQHEGVMLTDVKVVGLVHGHQDADEIGGKESFNTLNVDMNGDTFSREDEGTGTEKGNVTLLDERRADNGDHVLEDEMLDKLSEHSEEDDYTAGAFSGPIAFSGMLSYSGMISYSGQVPYSGSLSLHSDSSTSTRSFAFPILASDWNSSPAKIGQPDSRFFRRRRRWRPRFCCRRPTTLFD